MTTVNVSNVSIYFNETAPGDPLVHQSGGATKLHDVFSQPIVPTTLIIGVCLAVTGNLMISVAMNVQKYALTLIQRRREEAGLEPLGHYDYLTSWLWWLGIGLMVLGEGGNFMAYGFGPASVIAPLGTTTVVANAYISRCLGEKIRCQDILGTVIIVVGAFLIVIFSTQNEAVMTADSILRQLKTWPFLVYLAVEVVLFILVVYLRECRGLKHVILFILPAAILASLTVLGAKAASSMVALAIRGNPSQLTHPIFYLMVVLVLITGVLQIRYVTRAMQEYEASVVVPVFFVFFTLSAILVGVFFYGEFAGLTALRICMFLIGCLCSFIGVFMITNGRDGGTADNSTEAEPKDEAAPSYDEADRDCTSPLLPTPCTLHLVQPERKNASGQSHNDAGDVSDTSSDRDVSSVPRNSTKWPPMDKASFHPQIGSSGDVELNQRKPHKTETP